MAKAGELVRSLPYPALEDGNMSYPEGEYLVEAKPRQDGASVVLNHALRGAAFLERAISEGKARYGCLVAVPLTGYRKLHLADDARQQVEWKMDVVGEPPILRPLIVATSSFSCILGPHDGVAEAWQGREVEIPSGARLALQNYLRPTASLHNLLRVEKDTDLPDGCFQVVPCQEDGFYFKVHTASNLFSFMQNAGGHQAHCNSVRTHVVSRCFEILVRGYGESAEEEEAPKWEAFSNLKALREMLEEHDLLTWDDKDFLADEVATKLYPHVPPRLEVEGVGMPCEKFEDASYTKLRKNLLKSKGSDAQREFLSVLCRSDEFPSWMRNEVRVEEGEAPSMLEEPLTESEFKDPPESAEERMFEAWKSLSPADACRVTLWGFITLRHIEAGRIQSSYLAANGGDASRGLERIERVLKGENKKEVDDVVRTAIRRMSGLPEARGNRSVYVNCPFARAWWRGHLTREICEQSGAEPRSVRKVLSVSQSYWEELINLVVSRNSVPGDVKVRTALIWALSELMDDPDKERLFQGKSLKRVQRRIGVRAAWQELGVFPVEQLKEMMKNEFIAAP